MSEGGSWWCGSLGGKAVAPRLLVSVRRPWGIGRGGQNVNVSVCYCFCILDLVYFVTEQGCAKLPNRIAPNYRTCGGWCDCLPDICVAPIVVTRLGEREWDKIVLSNVRQAGGGGLGRWRDGSSHKRRGDAMIIAIGGSACGRRSQPCRQDDCCMPQEGSRQNQVL